VPRGPSLRERTLSQNSDRRCEAPRGGAITEYSLAELRPRVRSAEGRSHNIERVYINWD
jgi:hypothetical protein